MTTEPPPGQGPINPQGAFSPPPPPNMPSPPQFGPPPFGGAPQPPPMGAYPPPPMFPPGFMGMGYPPPPPRRSILRSVLSSLLVMLLFSSIILNVYLLAASSLFGGSGVIEKVVREGNTSEKIAVIPIEGIIDGDMATQVSEWIRRVEKDQTIKGIVLSMDTPGGGVSASDQIHHRLDQLRSRRGIPIAVSMGGLAASGGYYIACGADQIYAQPTTLTGSIGVIMPRYNLSEMARKIGLQENNITSPPKGYKNAGSMFQPLTPDETAYFQGLIDNAYARFIQLIQAGRKNRKNFNPNAGVFDGRILTAEQAEKNGLIDAVGYPEDAYDWVKTKAGLSKPMVFKYQQRLSLLDALGAKARVSAGGGVNVNVDTKLVEEMRTPRPMYLWRGQ